MRVAAQGVLSSFVMAASAAFGAPPDAEFENPFEIHAQTTFVRQLKPAFDAQYDGPQSLSSSKAYSYSLTATLFMAARLPASFELYFNPEAAQGVPFSNLQGLGGFSNGELARTSGATLKAYRARAFVRKTWNFGAELEPQELGANQVATQYSSERVVLTAGNVWALDLFGTVDYTSIRTRLATCDESGL
jgi:high affinity Mn2+ porin